MQKNVEETKEGNDGSANARDEEAQRGLMDGVDQDDELDVDGDRLPVQGR